MAKRLERAVESRTSDAGREIELGARYREQKKFLSEGQLNTEDGKKLYMGHRQQINMKRTALRNLRDQWNNGPCGGTRPLPEGAID